MGNKKTDTYDVIYSSIRRISKLRTSEGEIRFTATMKLIYAYIWTFQSNKKRGNDDPIHTNTNVIAWEMGVSEKTVIDALKALDAAKVVIKGTEKVRGNVNSSNYVAIPPKFVAALGITPPHPNDSKSKTKTKKIAAQPKIEESENGAQQQEHEQPTTDTPETYGPIAEQTGSISPVDAGGNASLPANDDAPLSDDTGKPIWFRAPFKRNGDLVPEAKAWARLKGATSEDEEKREIWRMLEILKPPLDSQSEAKQPAPKLKPVPMVEGYEDPIPF